MEKKKKRGPENDAKDRVRLMRLQKEVHQIGVSDAFLDAIEEVRTDPEAAAELKANPKAHLKGKGVHISDEIEVEFKEESPGCIIFCFYWWWWRICIWYCW